MGGHRSQMRGEHWRRLLFRGINPHGFQNRHATGVWMTDCILTVTCMESHCSLQAPVVLTVVGQRPLTHVGVTCEHWPRLCGEKYPKQVALESLGCGRGGRPVMVAPVDGEGWGKPCPGGNPVQEPGLGPNSPLHRKTQMPTRLLTGEAVVRALASTGHGGPVGSRASLICRGHLLAMMGGVGHLAALFAASFGMAL
jgi:hypothetical protein